MCPTPIINPRRNFPSLHPKESVPVLAFRPGHFHRRFHILCVRPDAGGRGTVMEEIRFRGTDGSLRKRKLETVFSHAQEQLFLIGDVKRGIGFEDDDVAEEGTETV